MIIVSIIIGLIITGIFYEQRRDEIEYNDSIGKPTSPMK